jgi:Flp pilus assembly protein TadG
MDRAAERAGFRRRVSGLGSAACRRVRWLGRDSGGHALVEAALVFPLLLSLFLGISEFSEALTVNRRVEAAAGTSADLVARLKTVTTEDLEQIKPMIDAMLQPYPTATLSLVISSVVADADNETTVAWSHAEGAGVSARAAGSVVALPAGLTEPNSSVILAEVRYGFRSTLTTLIVGELPMAAEAYVRPRLAARIEKTD